MTWRIQDKWGAPQLRWYRALANHWSRACRHEMNPSQVKVWNQESRVIDSVDTHMARLAARVMRWPERILTNRARRERHSPDATWNPERKKGTTRNEPTEEEAEAPAPGRHRAFG